jgi:hypothetical protein
MPGGPARGTTQHRAWVVGEIAAWLATGPSRVSRSAWIRWQQAHRRDAGMAWCVNRDVANDWGGALEEAHGAAAAEPTPYVGAEPPTSEAREPHGDHIFPPVPPGFEPEKLSTYVNGQWIKVRRERLDDPDTLARMIAELPDVVAPRDYVVPAPAVALPSDVARAYCIGDHHLGMYADPNETGGGAWDADIADLMFRAAFDVLTREGQPASRAYICDVGDFLHVDDTSNKTFKSGHALDVSERWPKLLRRWRDMMVHAIDRCLEAHDSVVVEILRGNHNGHSAVSMALMLDAYYLHETRVTVSQSDAFYRFHKWGEVLIGLTHGDGCKLRELDRKMSNLAPDLWGATVHRYWYTGHTHHIERHELDGCVAEVFRTLAPVDAYAAKHAYRSGRSMEAITLHKRRGEIARNRVCAWHLEQVMRSLEAA